ELSLSYLSLCERENSFSIHFPSQILQRFSSQKKVNQEECYIPLDSLQPFRACFFGIPNDHPHENRLCLVHLHLGNHSFEYHLSPRIVAVNQLILLLFYL